MANVTSFHDLLYIHPSDTPGMHLINEQLIGAENYGVWSRALLIALRAKNKLGFIEGTCQRPAVGSAMFQHWERCNALALSWIMNYVSKEIFCGIVYSTDASVVWTDLKDQFDKINGSRIFLIHRDIGRLTQGNLTVSVYFCKLTQLWDEYASLVTLPSCACATTRSYVKHDQQHKLLQFLMGLNVSYLNVQSQILMMNPLPMVGQAFSLVSQEESHRSLVSMAVPASVFYSAQNRNEEQWRDNIKCEHRNWKGHTKAQCYKLIGYPPGHRFHKSQSKFNPKKAFKKGAVDANVAESESVDSSHTEISGPPSVFTPAQYAEILKLLGSTTLPSSNDPMANMAGPQEWEDHGDW